MKVLVMSDSHGSASRMAELFESGNYRAVIFLGDVCRDTDRLYDLSGGIPVYRVKGNCDICSPCPEEQLIELCGKKILICHGHKYSVKSGYSCFENAALASGVDCALCGHTHKQYLDRIGDVVIANPGSVAGGCYGVLTVDDKKIDFELRSIYD